MFYQFAHNASVDDVVATKEGVVEHMTDGGHWLGDGGFAVFWMFVMMAVVILVVVLIVKMVGSNGDGTARDPLEIVKARYANGEIDKKEYEKLTKDLGSK